MWVSWNIVHSRFLFQVFGNYCITKVSKIKLFDYTAKSFNRTFESLLKLDVTVATAGSSTKTKTCLKRKMFNVESRQNTNELGVLIIKWADFLWNHSLHIKHRLLYRLCFDLSLLCLTNLYLKWYINTSNFLERRNHLHSINNEK